MKHKNEHSILALSADKNPIGANAKILKINSDTGIASVVADLTGYNPDGIGIDKQNKRIYFTHMGKLTSGEEAMDNDGSIHSVNFEGEDMKTIIPAGSAYTPKQMVLDLDNNYLYWGDREGMKVMRSNLDGSGITALVQTGETDEDRKDERNHVVGIAFDNYGGYIYWTEKGPANGNVGKILRAGLHIPEGQTASNRTDIEVIFENLPEPIDLEIDHKNQFLYWTDRGEAPLGNTLNRAPLKNIGTAKPEIMGSEHQEIIGLAISEDTDTAYTADLGGTLRKFQLDDRLKKVVYTNPELLFTGIALL
ncbi:YncE family protein [Sphingobacterium hungaricum]